MKRFLRTLCLLIIFAGTLNSSWVDKWSLQPTFQNTYNYIKSIDPKYLVMGGTLFGIITSAYLYDKLRLSPEQTLVKNIISRCMGTDRSTYFPRGYGVDNPLIQTVWNNKIIKDLRNSTQTEKKLIVIFQGFEYNLTIRLNKDDDDEITELFLKTILNVDTAPKNKPLPYYTQHTMTWENNNWRCLSTTDVSWD